MNLNFDPLKDGKPYVSKDPFTTAMRFIRGKFSKKAGRKTIA